MNKEYGGYLPLELYRGNEHYSTNSNYEVRAYNSGRAAIFLAINDSEASRCWIPNYLCEYVKNYLIDNGVSVVLYNINEKFEPINIDYKEGDIILYVNYFGLIPEEYLNNIAHKYKRVIFDNTQAFFQKPVFTRSERIYNVYSCRKFFGVNDGAYLISSTFVKKEPKLMNSCSDTTFSFLVSAINNGTNAAYQKNLENEKRIASEGTCYMSPVTKAIMSSIDYENSKTLRIKNFSTLHKKLRQMNELSYIISDDAHDCMVYPLLIQDNDLRDFLIENKIYIPQWWKYILSMGVSNNFERKLSKYLLPLPIDQRYNDIDMEFIANIIIKYSNNNIKY